MYQFTRSSKRLDLSTEFVLHNILILARHLTLFLTKSYFDIFIIIIIIIKGIYIAQVRKGHKCAIPMVSVVIYLGGLGTFLQVERNRPRLGWHSRN